MIITADRSALTAGGTYQSATVHVEAQEFEAQAITFENTYGHGSQAVALSLRTDQAIFHDCRFLAWQDTLYASSGRMYLQDCFIEGDVDFIFGDAKAIFEACEIHSRGPGYITAQGRTSPDKRSGFVFRHCRLTGNKTGKGLYLGRPWRPYARVVYVICQMEKHIRAVKRRLSLLNRIRPKRSSEWLGRKLLRVAKPRNSNQQRFSETKMAGCPMV